jgi:hypothetical protein
MPEDVRDDAIVSRGGCIADSARSAGQCRAEVSPEAHNDFILRPNSRIAGHEVIKAKSSYKNAGYQGNMVAIVLSIIECVTRLVKKDPAKTRHHQHL